MSARPVVLEQAARLLAQSPTGDISTRAVCEAAGVTQPVLYRMFGDKNGLLVAVVDHVWDQFLSAKRAAERSEDPLEDLFSGWDGHVAFAMQHPHAYRLLFANMLSTNAAAADEAMAILVENLDRLAAQGRLRIEPTVAAKLVMAANSGVALAMLRTGAQANTSLSQLMRESLYRSLLTDGGERMPDRDAAAIAATTLTARLGDGDDRFTPSETALFVDWLNRFREIQRPE
ncbi:TetR/AcrR family transcriptional regulator [Microbacterium maritypicum]|uniref:TetR/AcrR family transcriptional regulator n=1 Tax=Microbacterium maritypicum TaxID=33918 RepID=UPI0038125D77